MSGNVARVLNKCAKLSLKESALLRVSKNAMSALQRRLENATLKTIVFPMVSFVLKCPLCSVKMCPKRSVGMNLDSPVNRFSKKKLG